MFDTIGQCYVRPLIKETKQLKKLTILHELQLIIHIITERFFVVGLICFLCIRNKCMQSAV